MVLTTASSRADSLYAVSANGGWIGTYSTVSGSAFNANLVTGLISPEAIAFDPSLNFYVTGFSGEYVAKYQQDGTLINANYLNPSDFRQPTGIAVNAAGEIFVVNNALMPYQGGSECTVSKFQADGTLINSAYVPVPGSPAGATLDSADLNVVRWAESAVGQYTTSGTEGTILNASFLTTGTAINTWRPYNVARDSQGNFYVTGMAPFDDTSMVSKFASDGTLIDASLISVYSPGFAQGYFYGLAIDSQDNIFVGTYNGTTIGKYRPDGTVVNASFITGLGGVTSLVVQPVPEPSTYAIIGMGLAAAAIMRIRPTLGLGGRRA